MLQFIRLPWLFGAIVVVAAGVACYFAFIGPRKEQPVISAKIAETKSGKVETATFGAGCFWGVELTFRQVPGVLRTGVGYTGGRTENPTYRQVCTDTTGHAEVVQIEFDPEQVSYEQLLDIFWSNHNPTTLNRQGPDVGTQYRSAVFFHDDAQRAAAEAAKQRLTASGKWSKPIVTEIVPFTTYYPAEEYHQQYLEKNGRANCHL